jgi:RNA polymerase sigma-70 factor (ECF subfamily)
VPDKNADSDCGEPAAICSDEQLMLEFSRGSANAFAQLFSRYKQPVFGFFRRRVADPALAEELTQETFLAVMRGASRYQPLSLFRTYLYATGLNILRTHRRKAAVRAMFFVTNFEDHEPTTRNTLDTTLWLRHAVAKLESHDREILLLREFEQLSYAEIAELQKLPINTVRSRLFRARLALRDLLLVQAPHPSTQGLAASKERA